MTGVGIQLRGHRGLYAALAFVLVIGSLTLGRTEPATAAPQPGFQDQVVLSGLLNPTTLRFAPDGRIFVAEKSGLIKVFAGLNDPSAEVVADLRTQVHNFWDRGLLGMALHPDFPSTPYMYLSYTHDAALGETAPRWGTAGANGDPCPSPPGATGDGCLVSGRLSRFEITGDVAGPEQVMIEDWCQQYPSHSVGDLEFGPDGALYMSGGEGASFTFVDYGQKGTPNKNPCGDPPTGVGGTQLPPTAEGGSLRSQDIRTSGDPTSLSGTVIRIDPMTAQGLPDNPFSASSDANERRIIAHGLRNPFRLAFQPGSDSLFIGEVGANVFDEVDRIADVNDASVENFGWPCYEGTSRLAGFDSLDLTLCESLYSAPGAAGQPFFQYQANRAVVNGEACGTADTSVSGVAFYPGGDYPSQFDGALFVADYSRNCIWVMYPGIDGGPNPATIQTFVGGASGPVDLVPGPNGDIFYPDFNTGTIHRIRYAAVDNTPPTARIVATPDQGPPPLEVTLDASTSSDANAGDSMSFAWDLDEDGVYDDASTAVVQHTFTEAGSYQPSVQVSDAIGANDTTSTQIIVSDPPVVTIDTPLSTSTWSVGDEIPFSGSATDIQDGTLPPEALSWSLILHHCGTSTSCHTHTVTSFEGVASGSFSAPDHEYPSHLELRLRATDSDGLVTTRSVSLEPETVIVTMKTSPAGLDLTLGDGSATTRFTAEVIKGSTNSISAPSPQTLDGFGYAFESWSDGGARSHEVVVNEDTTYTANYRSVQPLALSSPSNYGTDLKPHSVVDEDVNGDGDLDLVTANSGANTVSVLFGRPDGTFGPAAHYGTGLSPKYAATGDFTGDGKPDIVSANEMDNNISLLRNNGDGTFAPLIGPFAACDRPHEVTAGNVNADAHLDIVASCWFGQRIAVILGNGDGTFKAPLRFNAGKNPHSAAIADFNQDGKNDVAIAPHGEAVVSVLLGNGDGTLRTAVKYPIGGLPHEVRAADFSGDGTIDLATANDGESNISILLGRAAGTFAPHTTYPAGAKPMSLTITDLNRDGRLDIATANSGGYPNPIEPVSVGVHLGRGDGSFEPLVAYPSGPHPFSIASGDLNHDGNPDLIEANFSVGSSVSVLMNGSAAAEDTTAPSVAAKAPAAAATGVPVSTNVSATFSEPIDAASVVMRLEDALGNAVPGTTNYEPTTKIATFDPTDDLAPGAAYSVRVSDAHDLADNVMAPEVWSFVTLVSDITAPTVTARAPNAGATGVPTTTQVTATFSEPIDPASISFVLEDDAGAPISGTTSYDSVTRTVTLDPDVPLAAGSTYTAHLTGATDGAGNAMSPDSWSFTTAAMGSATVYLSDLPWLSATNGFGPAEKDTSNGEKAAGDGRPITINGATFSKGLGVHATSQLVYNLDGRYSNFMSYIGIDDEVGETRGSVTFRVLLDNVEVYQSDLVTGAMGAQLVSLDTSGADQLTLQVNNGDGAQSYDHGDWAGAALVEGPPPVDTTPPSITIRNPAAGATAVAISTNVTATFNEAVDAASVTVTLEDALGNPVPGSQTYEVATRTVTFDPNADLNPGASYVARVTGATDTTGNTMAPASWSFATVTPDLTAPVVTARSPGAGVTEVATSTNVTATFSEPVSGIAFSLEDAAGNPVATTSAYDATSRTATLDPTAALTAGTTYTARVSGATDGAGNAMAPTSWSFTTASASPTATYLSDLPWLSATNGFGPVERDRSNGEKGATDGGTITINGTTFSKGLGTHAVSQVVFDLGGRYSNFMTYIGVDDEIAATRGTVVFRVLLDGVVAYESGTMTGAMGAEFIALDVTGKNQLTLQVNNADGSISYDHADWAGAVLEAAAP